MENPLFWLLSVSAIAAVSMLALLLAARREVKRLQAELQEFFTAKTGSSEGNDELAALRQQLQASRGTIERMRGEIQALRAESNSRIEKLATRSTQSALEFGPASTPSKNPIALETRAYIGKRYPRPRRAYLSTVILLLGALAAALYYVEIRASKVEAPQPVATGPASRATVELSKPVAVPAQLSTRADVPAPSEKSAEVVIASLTLQKASEKILEKTAEKTVRRSALQARSASSTDAPYQVIRSTRVFGEPNDRSQPLARIEAGMQVNVVGVKDDWLEVRSRHGRPSGFIRSDAAVPTAIP
jgi:hypothetical protein